MYRPDKELKEILNIVLFGYSVRKASREVANSVETENININVLNCMLHSQPVSLG